MRHFFVFLGRTIVLFCALQLGVMAEQGAPVEIQQWSVQSSSDGMFLSAQIKLELPQAVVDALQKGIPITFRAEADVFRERWYWIGQRVTSAQRTYRLSYQTLSKAWRVTVGGEGVDTSSALTRSQGFSSFADAVDHLRRILHWQIADSDLLEDGRSYRVEFRYRLDVSQLALPMQIGTLGQSDWSLTASASHPLRWERGGQ